MKKNHVKTNHVKTIIPPVFAVSVLTLVACNQTMSPDDSLTVAAGAMTPVVSASTSGSIVIDDFVVGGGSWSACGNPAYVLHTNALIIGGKRQLMMRDAHSCALGGAARMRIDVGAGTLAWYGATGPEHHVTYGTEIGKRSFSSSPSPSHHVGNQLNLSLSPQDTLRIDASRIFSPPLEIRLRSGTGQTFSRTVYLGWGTNKIAFSSFKASAAALADIDGISFSGNVTTSPENAPNGGNVYTYFGIVKAYVPPPTVPPQAVATALSPLIAVNGQAVANLDGSASTDDKNAITSYEWFDAAGTLVATGASATVPLAVGTHALSLVVTDDEDLRDTATVSVTVLAPPVAVATATQTALECTDGGATAQLKGSASSDVDGTIASYQWFQGGTLVASTANAAVALDLGAHTLTLRVTDNDGLTHEDQVTVTVYDNGAPTVTLAASTATLWPINHKYNTIKLTATATDACYPSSDLTATGHVVSNEPDNAGGDGNTIGDIKVTRPGGTVLLSSNANPSVPFNARTDALELRAERSGSLGGRIYTVYYTVTDASGNAATTSTVVTVPHDQGNSSSNNAVPNNGKGKK